MSTKLTTAAVLAASTIACTAGAGMITMTASSPIGSDDWSGLTGYSMKLTIDCATLNDAGSASSFTLSGWEFAAFDSYGAMQFRASGSGESFTVSGGSSKFTAVIGLSNSNITLNNLVPMAQAIAFTYAFAGSESLNGAITASANTNDGQLQLGTDLGGTGILAGSYAVPAPGAAALLGLAGFAGRRRRA
jgi:MYXO-CTERM domain-containing protein